MSETETTESKAANAVEAEIAAQQAEARKRRRADERLREMTKVVYDALRCDEIGLQPTGASLLTVHIFAARGEKAAAEMKAKDVREFASSFRHQQPVCWASLTRGNIPQFLASMRRTGIETAPESDFVTQAPVIRG